jgi:aspartyl protease family protein
MTVIAWLIFLAILFTGSDYLISKRNNPNQQVETKHIGLQKQVLLTRNVHGHYVSNGTINNHDVVFLLDTGASDIAIPESIANEIGLTRGYAITIKTANGNTTAYRTKINSAAIGEIKLHDLNATILTNMHGGEILLGMSFLKHLELIQKGKTLTIRQ